MVTLTKPMIDLVRELRRHASAELKPAIKLANPELFEEVVQWHKTSKSHVAKALIRELLRHAGEEWVQRVDSPEPSAQPSGETSTTGGKRYITRVYRGQTQLVEATGSPDSGNQKKPPVLRVYRGQRVGA